MDTEDCKEAERKLAAVEKAMSGVSDKLDALADNINSLDSSDLLEETNQEKLTKKQRKQKAKEFLNKRYPKLALLLKEIKELVEGVSFEIDNIKNEAEAAIEDIGEAESLIEEAREKLERF